MKRTAILAAMVLAACGDDVPAGPDAGPAALTCREELADLYGRGCTITLSDGSRVTEREVTQRCEARLDDPCNPAVDLRECIAPNDGLGVICE